MATIFLPGKNFFMSDFDHSMLPTGFQFAAGHAGIRKNPQDDLALIVSDSIASAAGVFTTNAVRAAPVNLSAEHLRQNRGKARLIVANAGNANCATPNMETVAMETARAASELAGIPENQVLLSSTGVIGEPMDEAVIPRSLPNLWAAQDRQYFPNCARAIMTTDTVPKMHCCEVETKDGMIRLAGMAKGAGMIMPNMATMLSFLVTDATIAPEHLQRMLKTSVDKSFNCITVDSDTSTNDTVFILANGASGVPVDSSTENVFQQAFDELTRTLAIAIVKDGEGAKKLAAIEVTGANDDKRAKDIAMSIANSPLVKTALAGEDPNWGRLIAAAGKAGIHFDPCDVDIFLNGTKVCENGMRALFDEPSVHKTMQEADNSIQFMIKGTGLGCATVWTCDFTEDYIRINTDYRT